MARKYEQRVRAEKADDTRRRIVDAAIALHGSVGPAGTTVSAVAEGAGVQRNTFYRHFPDERSLLLACSGDYMERNPLPHPSGWDAIADPLERARVALGELYSYYEANEAMTGNVIRDAEVSTLVREINALRTDAPMAAIADSLAAGWPHPSASLRAAVGLALAFATWRSLVREGGLTNAAAAALMAETLEVAYGRTVTVSV